MQRWFRATAAIGVSAALAGVTVLLAAAAGPAAAGSVHDNFAYGSYAPAGAITSRLHGLAVDSHQVGRLDRICARRDQGDHEAGPDPFARSHDFESDHVRCLR